MRAALALVATATAHATARAQPAADRPVYRDSARPVEARVRDLLGRMTLDEKVAQLRCVWNEKRRLLGPGGRFAPESAAARIPLGVGRVERPSEGRDAAGEARFVNDVQRFLVERTRLGVPALMHEEALHGLMARDATSFPQAIALASAWDPALQERVFAAIAAEARARGAHQVLAPVVDVARDPRWGRIEETYGEDPYLVARLGVAAVRGLQGRGAGGALGPDRVLATLKHLTGHGQPESGENTAPAPYGDRVLREVFLPPFEAAVEAAGAASVMPSYNEFDGVPMHANARVLQGILRGEWGFRGTVVSDWGALNDLVSLHHVAADSAEAAREAILAGVDADLPDRSTYGALADLVRAGRVPAALVDSAVARTLRHKFLLGLFEHPYVDTALAARSVGDPAHRALAEEAARKVIVLLKNVPVTRGPARGGAPLLPLDRARLRTIAVVGPNAAEAFLGGYSDAPLRSVNVLDGIRRKAGAGVRVLYAEGVRITEPVRDAAHPARGGSNSAARWNADAVRLADPQENAARIREAAAIVRQSDVAVLVVGDNEQTSREAWSRTHLGDRTGLDLVGEQNALVRAVLATGIPTVVVLVHGRPLSINYVADSVPAVLDAWYPGQEGGTAVADVLFGDANPGGKLPVSIARSVGHLPAFYNYKPSARRGYLFDRTDALFPFGHGLSYTTFRVGAPQVASTASAERVAAGDSVPVRVDVTNTGARAGDEVVQLYLRQAVSSVTRPVMELAGFERVTLRPGETRAVTFRLAPRAFALWDAGMRHVVEPGAFDVMAGSSSASVRTARLTLSGDRAYPVAR
ncbi:beta-glucosidase [Gemmatimonadetes bacterium T265]|nr:beta-glucosidase [Gemmatimonadetes bacterium T265]